LVLFESRGSFHTVAIPAKGSRGFSWTWTAIISLLVLYGSLIPFQFDFGAYRATNGFGVLELAWYSAPLEDLVINVLIYLPLGLCFATGGWHSSLRRCLRLPAALAVGGLVSVLAETLQTGIIGRLASWTDVLLNMSGTGIGAVLAIALRPSAHKVVSRLRTVFAARPCSVIAGGLTIGLFLYHLAPFDFVTGTAELHDAFRRARLYPTAVGVETSQKVVLARLGTGLWFAALGYFAALARRERGWLRRYAFLGAARQGFTLVVILEGLQLLHKSHTADLNAAIFHGLAVGLGAWIAVYVVDRRTRSTWRQRRRLAVPSLLLSVLLVLQVIYLVGGSIRPAGWSMATIGWSGIRWIPFEAMWRSPMALAALDAAGTMLTYGIFGIALAIACRRAGLRHVWKNVTGILLLVAIVGESVKAASILGTADVTRPLLTLFAATLAAQVDSAFLCTPPRNHPLSGRV